MAVQLHFLVSVSLNVSDDGSGDVAADGVLRFWTGLDDIYFTANRYTRSLAPGATGLRYSGFGNVVRVGNLPLESGQNESRCVLELQANSRRAREIYINDPGPAATEIRQIWSNDGFNWTAIPRVFRGRLSNPRLTTNLYSVDVVQRIHDLDRDFPVKWSDQAQQAQYPNDRGFEMAAQLAAGFDIRWPP